MANMSTDQETPWCPFLVQAFMEWRTQNDGTWQDFIDTLVVYDEDEE